MEIIGLLELVDGKFVTIELSTSLVYIIKVEDTSAFAET